MRFTYASGSRPLEGHTIKRGIGIGGFGEVYFATSDAGKELALKRIQRNLDVELRGAGQCLNLKHPNLIALYDIRHDDHGQGWIVMEYVAGESLKDVIDRNPNGMPEGEVLRWFRGIAAGVAYLHDHGIVHRDLKPGNIFTDEGTVKIGDYGLSKFISTSRRSGQTESVGTFHYMAPEIGKGSYGREIDVYALGVILFEMLTGNVPFEGESSQEIIMKHLTAEPDLSLVPRPFREAIKKSLAKDPARRYANVEAMLAGLKEKTGPVRTRGVRSGESLFIGGDDGVTLGDVQEVVTAEPIRQPPEQEYGPVRYNAAAAQQQQQQQQQRGQDRRGRRQNSHGGQRRPAAASAQAGEEPIAKAVRDGCGEVGRWWQEGELGTPIKVLIIVVGALALTITAEIWVPTAIVLGAMYLVYFGVRAIVLALSAPAPPARTPQRAAYLSAATQEERMRAVLANKPLSQRVGELTGGMLIAATASIILSLVLMIGVWLLAASEQIAALSPATTAALFTWLAATGTIGAWSVLVLGKFWEDSPGEPLRRRFALLIAGLLVGGAALGLAHWLNIDMGDFRALEGWERTAAEGQAGEVVLREAAAHLAFFGGLFVLFRWWRQADPLRATRLRLLPVGAAVVFSLVFWMLSGWLAQPWGFMVAATIAIAVQIAAPWISRREQNRIRQQIYQA